MDGRVLVVRQLFSLVEGFIAMWDTDLQQRRQRLGSERGRTGGSYQDGMRGGEWMIGADG